MGDEFNDAAADLSDAAARTHVDALLWSNRRLLDLLVPKRDLRRFAFSPAVDVADPDGGQVVAELVSAGWWEDRGDAWYVGLRWPEWQLERGQVEDRRERETTKKRRQRAHARGDHSLCSAPCSSEVPVPSRVPGGSPRGTVPSIVPRGVPGGQVCRVHMLGRAPDSCPGCAADRKAAG